ncbi:MAG: DUF937 domain-containing protein [Planctomycetota bacterium]
MGFNLIETVSRTLTDNLVGQIGGLLGESEQRTRLGIAAGVPALLEGVIRSSETDAGMRTLERTLDEQEPSISDDFGQQLIFDNSRRLRDTGDRLTRSVLCPDDRVTKAISHVSGLGARSSKSLVSMLLPLVMGQLGKHRTANKLDTLGLRSCLSQQLDHARTALLPGMRGLFDGQSDVRSPSNISVGRIAGVAAATTGVVAASQLGSHDTEKVPSGYTHRPSDPEYQEDSHDETHAVSSEKPNGQSRNGTRPGGFVDLSEASDGELINHVYRYFDSGEHISNHQLMRRLGLSEQSSEELRDTLRRRGAMNPTSGRLVARSVWDAAYRNPAANSRSLRARRDAERRSMGVESSHDEAEGPTVANGHSRRSRAIDRHPNVREASPSWWPLIFLAGLVGSGLWLFTKYMVPTLKANATVDATQNSVLSDEELAIPATTDPGENNTSDASGTADPKSAVSIGSLSEFELYTDLPASNAVSSLFGDMKETLNSVVDVDSANTALPRLDAYTTRIGEIAQDAPDWSKEVNREMTKSVTDLMPTLNDSVHRVLGIGSLESVMEQPMMRLIDAVDSLIMTN